MSALEGLEAPATPLWGELRYGGELARLLVSRGLQRPALFAKPREGTAPVLLIPGFMAGDNSLALMRSWLRRRGHPVATSGMRLNAGCAEQIVARLQGELRRFSERVGAPAIVVGQSRGGALARSLAVREPTSVAGLLMLGAPVRDALAVSRPVMRTLRMMAALGDIGVSRVFSTRCVKGGCCDAFWADLEAPLAEHIESVSVFSRSDGIVSWRACLDPHSRPFEVDSSHCGMSVNPAVYELLEEVLDRPRRAPGDERAPRAARERSQRR
jgi:pimeloyl-ACP methyl ester carboxylesterase